MRLFGWFRKAPAHVRGLYEYHDGRRRRVADPVEVDALLRQHGGDAWGNLLSILQAADRSTATGKLAGLVAAQQDEAVRTLADLARKAFGLDPLGPDGSGVSTAEALNVLAGYLSFLADLKERYSFLPTLPARPATSPKDQDTGEWLASGSTSPDSGSGGPTN